MLNGIIVETWGQDGTAGQRRGEADIEGDGKVNYLQPAFFVQANSSSFRSNPSFVNRYTLSPTNGRLRSIRPAAASSR
jgi:hypothetical protein